MQTAAPPSDSSSQADHDNNSAVQEEEEMRKSGGWFGFGFGRAQEEAAAKEEAARLTREADIRRLYEAGTQREVLEELYNAEEVLNCIQKIDKERELLQFLEDEQLLEAAAEDAAIEEQNRLAREKLEKEKNVSKDEAEEASVNTDSAGDSEAEDLERSQNSNSKLDKKFKISFGDDEHGNVQTKVETQQLAEPTDDLKDITPADKTMDISLDDVNLLEVGLESVCGDEDHGKEDNNNLLPPSLEQQESEDDLLKELLNTEGEESSHFDDSVTTHNDMMESPTGAVQTIDLTNNPSAVETPVFAIDTSVVIREQSGITVDSYGSDEEVRRVSEAVSDLDIGSSHRQEEVALDKSEGAAEDENKETTTEEISLDSPKEGNATFEPAEEAEPIDEAAPAESSEQPDANQEGTETTAEPAETEAEEPPIEEHNSEVEEPVEDNATSHESAAPQEDQVAQDQQVKVDSGESGHTDATTDGTESNGVEPVIDEAENPSKQPTPTGEEGDEGKGALEDGSAQDGDGDRDGGPELGEGSKNAQEQVEGETQAGEADESKDNDINNQKEKQRESLPSDESADIAAAEKLDEPNDSAQLVDQPADEADLSAPMDETRESSTPEPGGTLAMTESSDAENEDQMDAEIEVEEAEAMSDDDDDAAMDDREQMETTSVEDDEELSEGSPQEIEQADAELEQADEEMNEDPAPVAMDAADEAVEEIEMNEAISDYGFSDVVVADEARKAADTPASGAESGSDGDSASSEDAVPPPPPPPAEPIAEKVEKTAAEEQVIEEIIEYVEEAAANKQGEVIEELIVIEDQDGGVVVEEQVIVDGSEFVEEEYILYDDQEEVIIDNDDADVEEVIVEDGDEEEVEEEIVDESSESSYADQVVESWHDVIEEEPEDLEAAVSALIAVVYKDEPDVDVESMLRRTRLPELYKYLKSQYWYKIHTNKEEAEKAAEDVEEKPSEITSVDDMLKGRLQGLIANVQQMDQSMSNSQRPQRNEDTGLDESDTRNLAEVENKGPAHGGSMLGGDFIEEEEDLLPCPPSGHVDKATIQKLSSKDRNQGGGRHHVAKYYEKAVNNRVQRVAPKAKRMESFDSTQKVQEPKPVVDNTPVQLAVREEDLPKEAESKPVEVPPVQDTGKDDGEGESPDPEKHDTVGSDAQNDGSDVEAADASRGAENETDESDSDDNNSETDAPPPPPPPPPVEAGERIEESVGREEGEVIEEIIDDNQEVYKEVQDEQEVIDETIDDSQFVEDDGDLVEEEIIEDNQDEHVMEEEIIDDESVEELEEEIFDSDEELEEEELVSEEEVVSEEELEEEEIMES